MAIRGPTVRCLAHELSNSINWISLYLNRVLGAGA